MRILVTGGRAPATLELLRLLTADGAEVQLAESLPWTIAALSRLATKRHRIPSPRHEPEAFQERLVALVTEEAIDVLIPTCEEIFHVVRLEDKLRPHCTLFTPTFAQLARLHSKWQFQQWMSSLGLSVPETQRFTDPASLRDHAQKHGPDYVYKPEWSRFATHVRIAPTDGAWVSGSDCHPARPWLAQRRIIGKEWCTYSWFDNGRCVAHTCYAMRFHEDTKASLVFRHHNHPAIEAWVAEFGTKTGITGQCSFDFIEDHDGKIFAIECNPRLTSGVHNFDDTAALVSRLRGSAQALYKPPVRDSALKAALLLFGWGSIRRHGLGPWWQVMSHARDVFFRWSDPAPALLWYLSYVPVTLRAIRHGVSPMAASTLDIEWNGESRET